MEITSQNIGAIMDALFGKFYFQIPEYHCL